LCYSSRKPLLARITFDQRAVSLQMSDRQLPELADALQQPVTPS
jgi:hypothetical protein